MAHAAFKENMQQADEEFTSLMNLVGEIQSLSGSTVNPYTTLTPEELSDKWEEVVQLVPQRDAVLTKEEERQISNEELRKKFAALANVAGPWIEQHAEYVATLGFKASGSLEDQLSTLRAEEQTVAEFKTKMEELENCDQVQPWETSYGIILY
jgi:actinin alpha